ncbi:DUF5081 family protein [Ornithinibacillus sp. L9]|uniref:DUF5081 family protein n=1 Tax=Ornithinibacillus caprae TaxID=2678566 RepID=A0A6N8FJW0_9BACI|nr:DUF5081 family protein [Ornithinibacillus caprae]MUK87588.1 DUF5081 family protein [Ornithinibacillus caprae]
MTQLSTDAFNVPELYLLAAAFGGNVLFGLPEKEIYQLKGEEVFEEAHNRLIEKQIITPDGKITKAGAIIIQAIEYYHQSKKYVRINNIMFAFSDHNDDELILLVELEEKSLYKLFVVSKAIVLKMLGEKFPIILREPQEEEKTFLKEELSNQDRHDTEQYDPGSSLINLEFFHLDNQPQEATNPSFYQQWLAFVKEEKLLMVDTVKRKYYHASQYWFLKVLFDEMEFPYKEAK